MEEYVISSKSHIDEKNNLFMDVTVNDHGKIMEKRLSIEDYLALFHESLERVEEWMEFERIPQSIYSYKVMSGAENTFKAVIVYPAKIRQFYYCNQQMLIPFPALCFYVSVQGGVKQWEALYALNTDCPGRDTPLYNYPFGNVREDGSCCFGNILVQDVRTVAEAPRYLDEFLLGETNNDLWYDKKVKGNLSQGDLIEKIRSKKVFPKKLLNPNGQVLGRLLEN